MDRRTFAKGATAAALLPLTAISTGVRGQTPPLRVRKNVQTMATTDPFFANYAKAVEKMHDPNLAGRRKWREQALIHLNFCVHGGADFFHWHRHYITQFELICGKLIGDDTFALPYWDWTANRGRIPDPFYDMNFLNVAHWNDPSNASSPNWPGGQVTTTGRRGLVKGRGLQDDPVRGGNFTPENIRNILGLSDYSQFWPGIEGAPHGGAHIVTGATASPPSGHMASGMSPLDPIFWLHHCNVDRLWDEWRGTTPPINRTYTNNFVDKDGNDITVTAADALDAAKLGFRYERPAPVIAMAPQTAVPPKQRVLKENRVGTGIARLGRTGAPATAVVGTPTSVPLSVSGVTNALFSQRTFRTPNAVTPGQLSAEGGRVLLKLNDVTIDKDADRVLVNVFVNLPDVKPTTPVTDPNYVGTFALFGGGGHGGGHGGTTVVLDASRALRGLLRDGNFNTEQLKVDLMAIPAAEGGSSDARVTVASIEAIRA
jgi:tyrosinase